MLNTNKIHSLVNSGNNNMAVVSRGTGINYQSFKSKMTSGSWTPDDIEKLSDFFNKPISYWFDKEENEVQEPQHELEKPKPAKVTVYECPECIEKEKRVYELTSEVLRLNRKLEETTDKLIASLEGRNTGKNGTYE